MSDLFSILATAFIFATLFYLLAGLVGLVVVAFHFLFGSVITLVAIACFLVWIFGD